MTEAEWLGCTDPTLILEFLRNKASDRKLRLFAVACCRRIWHLLEDERSRRAVEAAESFADDLLSVIELRLARAAALEALNDVRAANAIILSDFYDASPATEEIGYIVAAELLFEGTLRFDAILGAANGAADHGIAAAESGTDAPQVIWDNGLRNEWGRQCDLLRDIFGTPFRSVAIEPFWLAWNDGTVVKLAQSIYEDRAFDRLPILADALEDAGCREPHIVGHCRGSGPHCRGCWVVDLLLGKE
jgi:hypothetical protein